MEQGNFQLQCQHTGVIKAYMKMTRHKAGERNSQLSDEKSGCRWILVSAPMLRMGDPSGSINDLVRLADGAMYQAKAGGGGVQVHVPDQDDAREAVHI